MNNLVQNCQRITGLQKLQVCVVRGTNHRRPFIPPRNTALSQSAILRALRGGPSAFGLFHCRNSLQALGRQGGNAPVGRIENQRGAAVRKPLAPRLGLPQRIIVVNIRFSLAIVILQPLLLHFGRFRFGVEFLGPQLHRTLQRSKRGVGPIAAEIRMSVHRSLSGPFLHVCCGRLCRVTLCNNRCRDGNQREQYARSTSHATMISQSFTCREGDSQAF